jgi:ketosteroid isomerase-like protein
LGDPDEHKRTVRRIRQESQLRALPRAFPGEAGRFERPNPLSGLSTREIIVSVDKPGDDDADFALHAGAFPARAIGPTFLSYSPMRADGDFVFEEWESMMYGGDGTVYNNQYCWWLRMEEGEVVAMREYNDSHHAWLIFGRAGKWPDLDPPTSRRHRHHVLGSKGFSDTDDDTPFEVVDQFEMSPAMLADIQVVDGDAGGGGVREAIERRRRALAAGDRQALGRLHGTGFRHFVAGEHPFGWDHLPLADIYAPLVAHLSSPLTVRFGPIHLDGDVAFEEMDIFGRLDDGTVYHNWHTLVHELREGRIVQTREYMDTRHVWVVLGRWADWAAEPVHPRSVPRRSNLQEIAWTVQIPTMFCELERWDPFEIQG